MIKYWKSSLVIMQNKAILIASAVLVLSLFVSCNKSKTDAGKGKIIASVKDSYLFESDLMGLISTPVSKDDSIRIVEDFIDKWIHDELVYQKALVNLSKEEKDKTKEIDNYYKALITYEYENKLLQQQLLEEISEEEIESYYTENADQFILRKCIMQVIFLKLKNDAPDLDEVRKWYVSDDNSDHDLLFQYCLGNAELFNLDDEKWFFIDEVSTQIPLAENQCDHFSNNMHLESSDSIYTYLLRIKNIKKEGSVSPLEFEHERIKNTILHKKSLEFIKNVHEEIYTDGIKKKLFKIYE
jgi:hypothetical protein